MTSESGEDSICEKFDESSLEDMLGRGDTDDRTL